MGQVNSLEEVKAYALEAHAAQRAEMHAKVDKIVDALEGEASRRIHGAIERLEAVNTFARKMHAEQRVTAHARVDAIMDELKIKEMERVAAMERHVLKAPLQ